MQGEGVSREVRDLGTFWGLKVIACSWRKVLMRKALGDEAGE